VWGLVMGVTSGFRTLPGLQDRAMAKEARLRTVPVLRLRRALPLFWQAWESVPGFSNGPGGEIVDRRDGNGRSSTGLHARNLEATAERRPAPTLLAEG